MSPQRRGVAQGMAAGMLVAVVALAIGLNTGAIGAPTETLGAAVAILGLWVAATIGNVARLRFFAPDAIDAIDAAIGGGDPPAIRIAQAVSQNTLEQAVIAGFAYAALTLVAGSAGAIALLVGCFSVGRVLFWTGYARGAAARAFGFALTFYPSVLALLVVLGRMVIARVG